MVGSVKAGADDSWRWNDWMNLGSRSPHVVGVGGTGSVITMETAAGGKCLDDKQNKRCTYDRPGFLLCSFFLSRFGFLSSSVFFQCLLSFRLICLECKCHEVFL